VALFNAQNASLSFNFLIHKFRNTFMNNNYVEYQPYNSASQPLVCSANSSTQVFSLPQVWSALMRFLTANRQPHVKHYQTQSGASWWKIQDPATGRTAYCADEHDVRLWLDKCY
jgi:hypothetical protein